MFAIFDDTVDIIASISTFQFVHDMLFLMSLFTFRYFFFNISSMTLASPAYFAVFSEGTRVCSNNGKVCVDSNWVRVVSF